MRMKRIVRNASSLPIAILIAGLALTANAATSCQPADAKTPPPWKVSNAVVFRTAGLAVDADGAPDSYRVDGKGLSDTCDGVAAIVDGKRVTSKTDRAHWVSICRKAWADAQASGDYSHVAVFGFLKDAKGKPVVQGAGDPLPGEAYITTTTLTVPGTPDRTQRHWVDATKIPYVVLPPSVTRKFSVKPGDLAVVYRAKTDAMAFAIFADGGDTGEASVKLHRDLQSEPITTKGGVTRANAGIGDAVVTLVFPGVNVHGSTDADAWNRGIAESGKDALKKWGGKARLQACGKELVTAAGK